MARQIYVWREGRMVHKDTGEPMNDPDEAWTPSIPMVVPDTPGYHSPIDGKWIEGRRARRYDLESNNCIEVGDSDCAVSKDGFKNPRFAKKWGLPLKEGVEGLKDG